MTHQQHRISIIIPTIGSGPLEYLIEALDSAKSITSSGLVDKIIIVDNSNSPKLNELFSRYAAENNKFNHVIEPNQMTMAQCWNLGLSLVESQWVLYLHDDDVLNPEEFKKIEESQLRNDVGFIAFDFEKLVKKKLSYISIQNGVEGIIKNTPKFISTIYNVEKLRKIGGWDAKGGYALDLLALVKLSLLYGDLKINRSLGKYRIHEQNASSLQNRSEAYGDAIPYILNTLFPIISDSHLRRTLCFYLLSFTYPNDALIQKSINFLLRVFKIRGWFINF